MLCDSCDWLYIRSSSTIRVETAALLSVWDSMELVLKIVIRRMSVSTGTDGSFIEGFEQVWGCDVFVRSLEIKFITERCIFHDSDCGCFAGIAFYATRSGRPLDRYVSTTGSAAIITAISGFIIWTVHNKISCIKFVVAYILCKSAAYEKNTAK